MLKFKNKKELIEKFNKMKEELIKKYEEAKDVNNALTRIIPLSEEMQKSNLSNIVDLIPKLFTNIFIMWYISPNHYRKPKYLKEIMKKFADSLENKCKIAIQNHIDEMFEGTYHKCKDVVENSIKILEEFKVIFSKTKESVKLFREQNNLDHKFPHVHPDELDWEVLSNLEQDMFAQMKNFIGRCNNLKEICECISQFVIKENYPRFGGIQGEEIKKNFREIEKDFINQLELVKNEKDTILNTHATNWHDDFDKFRTNIKDMEKKICNIIDSSFVNQKSLKECI